MTTPPFPTRPVPPSSAGFRVTQGVALRIPAGALKISIDAAGYPSVELNAMHLRLDTSIHWLEIALDHLNEAGSTHGKMLESKEKGEDFGLLLQPVFKSSMQAIVASATFFEALYAASRECMPPARLAPRASNGSGAKRSALVTEQLKRAFGLKNAKAGDLASVLSEVYRFRDEAVHPSSSFGPAVLHPELGVLVERRLAMYTYANARLIVRAALAYCKILPTLGEKQGPKEIRDLAHFLLTAAAPLFAAWETSYGPLLDTP